MTCTPGGSHLLIPRLHFTGEKTEAPTEVVIYLAERCRRPLGTEALRLSQVQRLLDIRKDAFQGSRGGGVALGWVDVHWSLIGHVTLASSPQPLSLFLFVE